MSKQVQYALVQALVAGGLAVLAALAASQTDILNGLGLSAELYGGIVAAVIAAAVRTLEGVRDGKRAAGPVANMKESDVGFTQVQQLLYNGPSSKPLISSTGTKLELEVVPKTLLAPAGKTDLSVPADANSVRKTGYSESPL